MKPSAQSLAVFNALLEGGTASTAEGSVSLGPLSAPALVLLQVLLRKFDALDTRTGEDQIGELRRRYVLEREAGDESAARETSSESPELPVFEEVEDRKGDIPSEWRVVSLRCSSIRGIAPPGEEFEFHLGTESALLFGPNGSGKSSLLSVLCWVLTGRAFTDSPEVADEAPLYTVPSSGPRGSHFRDWPVVVTLPGGSDCRTATPTCWGELTLKAEATGREVRLRRTYGAGLEMKESTSEWRSCEDLGDLQVSPLDMQLSLDAPTVFGRQTLESAQNARDILSLMLGYDDLERLGELCSRMSGNRTRSANRLGDETDRLRERLHEEIAAQVERLPRGASVEADMRSLAAKTLPSAKEIEDFGEKVGSAITEAEGSIASILGLEAAEGKAPEGLADKLTVAVARLESDFWAVFPSIGALEVSAVFPDEPPEDGESELAKLEARMASFVAKVGPRIRTRLAWWKRENAPGSKATALLQASLLYDPEQKTCPVCEQSVADLPVADQLASLREADPELAKELRTFFADLCQELVDLLPEAVRGLGQPPVGQRLVDDWQDLKSKVLGPPLEPLTEATAEWVTAFAESLTIAEPSMPVLLPEDADVAFREAASTFVSDLRQCLCAISNLRWAASSLVEVHSEVNGHITDASPESDSLLAQLAKGKAAAAQVKPLEALRDDMRRMYKARKGIDQNETALADLEELRGAIDELKPLAKYAVAQVTTVFESIRDEALKHWRRMYPESSTGMKPGRLVLGSGRDKSVEALLSCEAYEVPGQHFANAGLQRAIALAFYFALLDRHPKGLGFVLLDDPILSLDDDHRERWSREVLRNRLDEFQVVLATHQRQYFLHCGDHFGRERTYELNPRGRAQRVSIRPGHELDRANAALSADWRTAPATMREYRDRVFLTLDSYSDDLFFIKSNFRASFDTYKGFAPPHILAGTAQRQIVAIFSHPRVDKVLDPGSHALTEVNLTHPMVEDCLAELNRCQGIFERELRRLDARRARDRRAVPVTIPLAAFPGLPGEASWASLEMPFIGRAAARSDPWVVDVAEELLAGQIDAGSLVLVTAESLDPVARLGQWAILASEEVVPVEGDLVAVVDEDGNRLLRRLWSAGDSWLLQPANPVKPIPCRLATKAPSPMRRMVGVVYLGPTEPSAASSGLLVEWTPIETAPVDRLRSLRAITVEGNSLNPVARKGQCVLVEDKLAEPSRVEPGALAAVVTEDDQVGNVLKRVYPREDVLLLVSPNPVDVVPPASVPFSKVRAIWPFAGVLFECMRRDGSD